MHSILHPARIGKNLVFLGAEALCAAMVLFVGAGLASLAGTTPLYAAFGFGLATLVCVSMFLKRTGAMITPGAAMLRAGLWMLKIEKREYSTPEYKIEVDGMVYHSMIHWVMDAVVALLVIGAQIGGALLGALVIDAIDKSGLLSAWVRTAPHDNLANDHGMAILAAWALNCVVLAAYCAVTSRNDKNSTIRRILAPISVGLAVFVTVFLSYTYGVGTMMSFASDLALAVVVPSTKRKLWISFVGQLTAAATVLVAAFVVDFVDRYNKHYKKHYKKHHHQSAEQQQGTVALVYEANM